MNVQRCYCSLLRRLAQASWETGSLPDSSLRTTLAAEVFPPELTPHCSSMSACNIVIQIFFVLFQIFFKCYNYIHWFFFSVISSSHNLHLKGLRMQKYIPQLSFDQCDRTFSFPCVNNIRIWKIFAIVTGVTSLIIACTCGIDLENPRKRVLKKVEVRIVFPHSVQLSFIPAPGVLCCN